MIKSTEPPVIGQKLRLLSYALGFWSTGLAVAQMISFEEFVQALKAYGLSDGGSLVVAISLLVIEIASIPFLFRLRMSPLMRLVSAVMVVLLPCAWTTLCIMALMQPSAVPNTAYFGGLVQVKTGVAVLTLNVLWLTIVGWIFSPLGGHEALRGRLK